MPKIAYIANQFPSPVEPYVAEEITALRERGVEVMASSGRGVKTNTLPPHLAAWAEETTLAGRGSVWLWLPAIWLLVLRAGRISDLLARVLLKGRESPARRVRALAHTWLGVCYAVQLRERGMEHIHAHHGYFASWIAMIAARLLGVGFSLTLHGSDLLLDGSYLDVKLENCTACFTISQFNRCYIRQRHPSVPPEKIVLRRLGVEIPRASGSESRRQPRSTHSLLAVGRLHPVKNHAFLIRACAVLRERGIPVTCCIAGGGPERKRLQQLITELGLGQVVHLLGQLGPDLLDEC
jgi:glycosyltransferase involved in cell wall biosynthesis